MHPIVQGLMILFDGFRHAYGTYSAQLESVDGTLKMKGRAVSIPRDVTTHQWEEHIAGKVCLGIIPINERSEVKFAAIDIDVYDNILVALNQKIRALRLPLVLCKTKSGGAHVYLFLREFTSAAIVQQKMREFAALLGYGNAEIFPKQTRIVPERGDIGQWINMPYFRAGDTNRYALNDRDEPMAVADFLKYATERMVTVSQLLEYDVAPKENLPDGPPCLNHLTSSGFPEGTRNVGLFNLGVYAKKISPEDWESKVESYNDKFINPPLESSEVLGVIKSLRKKDFSYACKSAPLCNFCNMPKCRTKKHGIGLSGTGLPKFGTLTKLMTEPVIWFLEVEGGGRLELTTEDLQNQRRFQNRCMESMNIMPTMMKGEQWQEIVQSLLETVTIVQMPVELTASGLLKRHLEEFCTGRAQANTREDILRGLPWTDNGYHYFRMSDFMDYLERRRFRQLDLNEIGMWMREWKAEKRFFNIKNRGLTVTMIPEFRAQIEKFEPPISDGTTAY